jgi:hypothetical protein
MQAAYGGTEVYVPAKPEPYHVLCREIGLGAVQKIGREIGYGKFMLPCGRFGATRQRRATHQALTKQLFVDGLSNNEIARKLGISVRTVEGHRRLYREGKL